MLTLLPIRPSSRYLYPQCHFDWSVNLDSDNLKTRPIFKIRKCVLAFRLWLRTWELYSNTRRKHGQNSKICCQWLPDAIGKPASLSKDHKKLSGSEPNKIFYLEEKRSQKATSQKLSLNLKYSGQSYEYRKQRQHHTLYDGSRVYCQELKSQMYTRICTDWSHKKN